MDKTESNIVKRWYVRYPLALAIAATAIFIASFVGDTVPALRVGILLVGLLVAILLMGEILILGVVGGLAYLIFAGVASIPVNIAIIIGAIIIGAAILTRR